MQSKSSLRRFLRSAASICSWVYKNRLKSLKLYVLSFYSSRKNWSSVFSSAFSLVKYVFFSSIYVDSYIDAFYSTFMNSAGMWTDKLLNVSNSLRMPQLHPERSGSLRSNLVQHIFNTLRHLICCLLRASETILVHWMVLGVNIDDYS